MAGLRNFQNNVKENYEETSVKDIKLKHENYGSKGATEAGNFELPPEEEMDAKHKRFFEED